MSGFDADQLSEIRRIVTQAVENEVNIQNANSKNRSTVEKLEFDMLRRDVSTLGSTVGDLKEVVLGNETLGVRGLIKQVHDIDTSLRDLNEKINKWTSEISGFRKALYVLGVIMSISGVAGIQAILKGFGVTP